MRYLKFILLALTFIVSTMPYVSCDDYDSYARDLVIDKVGGNTGGGNGGGNTGGGTNDDTPHYRECYVCHGTGDCQGSHCHYGICSVCGGDYKYKDRFGYLTTCNWCERGKCPACHGRGTCSNCYGRGYINY